MSQKSTESINLIDTQFINLSDDTKFIVKCNSCCGKLFQVPQGAVRTRLMYMNEAGHRVHRVVVDQKLENLTSAIGYRYVLCPNSHFVPICTNMEPNKLFEGVIKVDTDAPENRLLNKAFVAKY
jgi:hypothetical protein